MYRWIFTAVLLLLYFLRVFLAQGWYIITYGLGIFILNLFIGFLTPQSRESQEESDKDGLKLPTRDDEEYRPFTRRVPEFIFWYVTFSAFVCVYTMINVVSVNVELLVQTEL